MEYPVIVEQSEGVWRAVLPTLADLSAEGSSFDEALSNARRAAEDYLSKVVLTTIEVNGASSPPHSRSPRNWIESAGMFVGDEEAMLQHIEEIYAERRRQREEVEREYDLLDSAENGQ
jgi:predicted RNase H-like HicB family nuclease